MANTPQFLAAYPYQTSVLTLPVANIDATVQWYGRCFGMAEAERTASPVPAVILERNGVRIGFAVNGGDASQDGAAIQVAGIEALREELQSHGVKVGALSLEEREGQRRRVFFVAAPDGLCYYFFQPIPESDHGR